MDNIAHYDKYYIFVLIERELKLLTSDLQLGFGSFVDKTSLPFTIDQNA